MILQLYIQRLLIGVLYMSYKYQLKKTVNFLVFFQEVPFWSFLPTLTPYKNLRLRPMTLYLRNLRLLIGINMCYKF